MKLLNKIYMIAGIFLVYKNPLMPILDCLGLLGRGIITVRLRNGLEFRVRTQTSDLRNLNEIFIHRIYNKSLKQVNRFADPVIINIGAHIGGFSIIAGKEIKNSRIYSFEPLKENYDLLNENIKLNKMSNIKTYNLAVSNRRGELDLFFQEGDTGGAGISDIFPTKWFIEGRLKQTKVNCITLADVFEENKIDECDLLKIDAEGSEYKILYTAPFEKIKNIVLEYHANIDVSSLKAFLESCGFDVKIKPRSRLLYAKKL